MKEYAYSCDGEEYYNADDFIGIVEDEYETGDEITVFVGEKNYYSHSEFVNASRILEEIQYAAYEDAGRHAENYLQETNVTIENELTQQIVLFLKQHYPPIDFYTVINVNELEINVGDWSFIKDESDAKS